MNVGIVESFHFDTVVFAQYVENGTCPSDFIGFAAAAGSQQAVSRTAADSSSSLFIKISLSVESPFSVKAAGLALFGGAHVPKIGQHTVCGLMCYPVCRNTISVAALKI
ncbi:TPA: hypothetical protein ACFOV5_000204 [Neisseria meningitidis]